MEESQIWQDLTEAIPGTPLETSTSPPLHVCCNHLIFLSLSSVKKSVTIHNEALSACTHAEAIVVATEWKEFRDIDWQTVYDSMNKPAFVFDGRMLLDADRLREIGFKVTVIGKGDGL